jgi:hypothetical protein
MVDIAEMYDRKKLLRIAREEGLSKVQAELFVNCFLEEERKRVPDVREALDKVFREGD